MSLFLQSPDAPSQATSILKVNYEEIQTPTIGNISNVVSQPSSRYSSLEETLEQKQRREEEESEKLAWELMMQESIDSYRQQLEYMIENKDGLSQEDLAALEIAMKESGYENAVNEEDPAINLNESDGERSDTWTYDNLLGISEAIGGYILLVFFR